MQNVLSNQDLLGIAAALGVGLLIGTVRERRKLHSTDPSMAGLRTHAIAALGGALAYAFSEWLLLGWLLILAGLVGVAYRKITAQDPGLTGEIALLLTALLGGVALKQPALAAGVAVVVAALLFAKGALHRLSRELLSEHEVQDGLALLAAILIVLPLLPDRGIGPGELLNPYQLWKWVVLVMTISSIGHITLRFIGQRYGLALAGFFAGFVSSTAAIGGFGQRAKDNPALLRPSVAAAMWAALASSLLFFPLTAAVSVSLLNIVWPVFVPFAGVLLIGGVLGLRGGETQNGPAPPTAEGHLFRFSQALLFAAVLLLVLLLSKALHAWLGDSGAWIGAAIAALAEVHAAVASVAQLAHEGELPATTMRFTLLAVLAASVVARSVVAFTLGGRAYGARVSIGLLIAWCAAFVGSALMQA
jgi:uncharacterized membrane protein (DUF4010 family)